MRAARWQTPASVIADAVRARPTSSSSSSAAGALADAQADPDGGDPPSDLDPDVAEPRPERPAPTEQTPLLLPAEPPPSPLLLPPLSMSPQPLVDVSAADVDEAKPSTAAAAAAAAAERPRPWLRGAREEGGDGDPLQWTADDVAAWLQRGGYDGALVERVRAGQVDGRTLQHLAPVHLRLMGITEPETQQALGQAIGRLFVDRERRAGRVGRASSRSTWMRAPRGAVADKLGRWCLFVAAVLVR